MKILCLLPARAKSKGIKNKNLILLNGKPLIYYSLDCLKAIKNMVYPFVSSDSKNILKFASQYGFKEQYIRPKKLSGDKSKIIDVVFHAIDWLKKEKKLNFEAVALLQPTSPMRNKKEIKESIKLFKKKKINSLVFASDMYQHPYECVELKKDKWNYITKPSKKKYRRQDYKNNFYFIDGSFYIAKVSFLKKNKSFIKENQTFIYRSKNPLNIDIDNKLDLKLAKGII